MLWIITYQCKGCWTQIHSAHSYSPADPAGYQIRRAPTALGCGGSAPSKKKHSYKSSFADVKLLENETNWTNHAPTMFIVCIPACLHLHCLPFRTSSRKWSLTDTQLNTAVEERKWSNAPVLSLVRDALEHKVW